MVLIFDVIVVILAVLCAFRGFRKGLAGQVLQLAAFIVAGLIVFVAATPVSALLVAVGFRSDLAVALGGVTLFFAALLILSVLQRLLVQAIHQSAVSTWDRTLGTVLSLIKLAVILGFVLRVVTPLPVIGVAIGQSVTVPWVRFASGGAAEFVVPPSSFRVPAQPPRLRTLRADPVDDRPEPNHKAYGAMNRVPNARQTITPSAQCKIDLETRITVEGLTDRMLRFEMDQANGLHILPALRAAFGTANNWTAREVITPSHVIFLAERKLSAKRRSLDNKFNGVFRIKRHLLSIEYDWIETIDFSRILSQQFSERVGHEPDRLSTAFDTVNLRYTVHLPGHVTQLSEGVRAEETAYFVRTADFWAATTFEARSASPRIIARTVTTLAIAGALGFAGMKVSQRANRRRRFLMRRRRNARRVLDEMAPPGEAKSPR